MFQNFFTKEESRVILFLLGGFVIGFGAYIYRHKMNIQPPVSITEPDAAYDDMFKERSTESYLNGKEDLVDSTTHNTKTVKKVSKKKSKSEFTGKVNLNTAKKEELILIPSVGPKTADQIIDYRETHGPFQTIEDLKKVKGIGEKKLKKMKSYLTL